MLHSQTQPLITQLINSTMDFGVVAKIQVGAIEDPPIAYYPSPPSRPANLRDGEEGGPRMRPRGSTPAPRRRQRRFPLVSRRKRIRNRRRRLIQVPWQLRTRLMQRHARPLFHRNAVKDTPRVLYPPPFDISARFRGPFPVSFTSEPVDHFRFS